MLPTITHDEIQPMCHSLRVAMTLCCGLLMIATRVRAEPPALWLYYATNLQVDAQVDELERVWRRAAAAGYSHVLLTDSKFSRLGDLGEMTGKYFGNAERVKRIAAELKLEIVPALFGVGYSNDLLWHDPNLAEGLPVRDALFEVHDGEAHLVPDPPVAFGAKPNYKDDVVSIDGNVATVHDHQSNARFNYQLEVAPFRCYHVSVAIRTQDFTGQPEVKALAGDKSLQWQSLGVKPTQEWTVHHVVFNSLENRKVTLYFGVWGDAQGELVWKDWKIEEAGLVNVLRRLGAPCTVEGSQGRYVEGTDYESISDPRLGREPYAGQYEAWHEPPSIRTKTIPEGTKLRVSWFHPALIYDGQVSCCISEPKTMELLADEARRVTAAWGAKSYMMQHDEFRTLGWDATCQDRHLDAGALLADNARACRKLLGASHAYVWSDMFDPSHNAVKDYYLVRGDLAGSWEGLDPDVTIVNWNFEKRDKSLRFFADRGHKQVIAGYYDHDVAQVRQWLAAAANIEGVVGVMYTTWRHNYDDIEAFAAACKR